jgi:uncharacterized protein YuzE
MPADGLYIAFEEASSVIEDKGVKELLELDPETAPCMPI